jgi:hypothetical protein
VPEAWTIDERREKTMLQPVKVMLEQGKNGMLTHQICLEHIGSRLDRRPYFTFAVEHSLGGSGGIPGILHSAAK